MNGVYRIDVDGNIHGLYSDDVAQLGSREIARASNVEPDANGKWFVQLTDDPRNGEHRNKIIGKDFESRDEAIKFEVKWIEENIIAKGVSCGA